MKSFLPNRLYDILKYVAIVALPALAVCVKTIFPVWNIPFSEEISVTIMGLDTLLGALLCISTAQYNSKE